ncbi:MAG TPA: hypothetical protein VE084_19950 [Burkholderiaceae bacterium]|nr:hypothetical protein [Burkholderiaceae bacterium]
MFKGAGGTLFVSMTQKTTDEIVAFYLKQSRESTLGALKNVCAPNNIPLEPTSPSQLRAIPVYEDGYAATLYSTANERARTTISWPAVAEFNYLQAYVKKYRKDERVWNEVVVNATNYCWARFYAAKELMHCVTDDDGYAASDSIELVNDLIESLVSGSGALVHPKPQTIVDEIAWLGATEYLVPGTWVPQIERLHREMSEKMPDVNAHLHIAQLLRVPELVLRHRLKHRTAR